MVKGLDNLRRHYGRLWDGRSSTAIRASPSDLERSSSVFRCRLSGLLGSIPCHICQRARAYIRLGENGLMGQIYYYRGHSRLVLSIVVALIAEEP